MSFMYIVKSSGNSYVTVEPILNPGNEREERFPVGFAWTHARAEAVRFSTKWHAEAIVDALPGGGQVIEVKS